METEALMAALADLQRQNESLAAAPQIDHSTAFRAGAALHAALGAEKTTWLMGQVAGPTLWEWLQTADGKEWLALGMESYETHLKKA